MPKLSLSPSRRRKVNPIVVFSIEKMFCQSHSEERGFRELIEEAMIWSKVRGEGGLPEMTVLRAWILEPYTFV